MPKTLPGGTSSETFFRACTLPYDFEMVSTVKTGFMAIFFEDRITFVFPLMPG
jgi:hypothetical protein